MNRQTKRRLVESLNKEFEDIVSKNQRAKYGSYIRSINEAIVNELPQDKKAVRAIVARFTIRLDTSIKLFTLLAGVSQIILGNTTPQSRALLAPLEALTKAYDPKRPKAFAKSMYELTTGRGLSARQERFRPLVLSYYGGFTENIESLEKQALRALQRSQVESASLVFQDLETLREARVPLTEIKKELIAKYNDPKRVVRALNTELHEQAERTKLEQSKFMGYNFKIWNTQRDERVRVTSFHTAVTGKKIPIDEPFKGGGQSAEYPGDVTLDVGERINCRCYITYSND
jgi:hypothetical protein